MKDESTNYVPGVCNINTEEIARRRKAGHFGLALTLVLFLLLFGLSVNRYLRVILFIPLFIAAIGYLQAKNKFCVGYGATGIQHADENSNATSQVSTRDAAADKKKTYNMYIQAILISLIATCITVIT